LALIEQDAGREVAIKVARILVVYLKRAGGQSQYSALLDAQAHSDSDPFNELEQWIAEHLRSDLRVKALADHVHMSPRNFARVYVQTRGRTPAKAVEAIRLDTARRRLEETTARIETIAGDCGFSGEEQMRLAFVRSLGIPPREYRKRFASASWQIEAGLRFLFDRFSKRSVGIWSRSQNPTWQHARTGGPKLGPVDIVRFAEAFGAKGLRIESPDEISSTLKKALAMQGPVLVGVPVDYRDNHRLMEIVHPDALNWQRQQSIWAKNALAVEPNLENVAVFWFKSFEGFLRTF
jgi:AraC-like DNA-binding protein